MNERIGPYIGKHSKFMNDLFNHMDVVAWTKPNDRHYAYQYALWAYEQGVREAVEKLRGADGSHCCGKSADWLQREFLGDEK